MTKPLAATRLAANFFLGTPAAFREVCREHLLAFKAQLDAFPAVDLRRPSYRTPALATEMLMIAL